VLQQFAETKHNSTVSGQCVCLFDRIWSGHDLELWPFNSKSNQLVFVSKCKKLVNFMKFAPAVYEIARSKNLQAWTDTWTHGNKIPL